ASALPTAYADAARSKRPSTYSPQSSSRPGRGRTISPGDVARSTSNINPSAKVRVYSPPTAGLRASSALTLKCDEYPDSVYVSGSSAASSWCAARPHASVSLAKPGPTVTGGAATSASRPSTVTTAPERQR